MKILVFSDSHGRPDCIRRAITAHQTDTDLICFLGDGVRDICEVLADFPAIPAVILQGNCDSPLACSACGIEAPEEEVRTLDGVKILMMHGHTAGVKYGPEDLLCRASKAGAAIALYGHTHTPENQSYRAAFGPNERILLFNPGSIGHYPHSYGVIYIVNGQFSAAHGEI